MALDESIDIVDNAQLAVFIRCVDEKFEVAEDLLDLKSMKGATTGKDIFEQILIVLNEFEINQEKLVSITTDGAAALTGKNIGFCTRRNYFLKISPNSDFYLPLHHPSTSSLLQSSQNGTCDVKCY